MKLYQIIGVISNYIHLLIFNLNGAYSRGRIAGEFRERERERARIGKSLMKTVYGRGPYGLSGRPTDASPWARAPPSCANYPSPFSPHLNDPVAPPVLLYLVYTQTTIYIYIHI